MFAPSQMATLRIRRSLSVINNVNIDDHTKQKLGWEQPGMLEDS